MMGTVAERVIHVVAADVPEDGAFVIITAYEPDPALWEPGFRKKRTP